MSSTAHLVAIPPKEVIIEIMMKVVTAHASQTYAERLRDMHAFSPVVSMAGGSEVAGYIAAMRILSVAANCALSYAAAARMTQDLIRAIFSDSDAEKIQECAIDASNAILLLLEAPASAWE